MSLCSRCRRRKAKRQCPALGSALCSLCCGQARNKDIHCPDSCEVLAAHKPYHDRRTVERNASAPESRPSGPDPLRDERLAWLAAHVEFPISVYGQGKAGLTDADVLLALEYARDKLKGSARLLVVPGEALRPRNELGEAILESMDKCRFEGTIVVPGTGSGYSFEEKERVLDRVILLAGELARNDPRSRNFVDRLIAHFAQVESRPEPSSRPAKK